jgi:hypothetical protein
MIQFDDIKTSTKTITILSNIRFTALDKIYEIIELNDFITYIKY